MTTSTITTGRGRRAGAVTSSLAALLAAGLALTAMPAVAADKAAAQAFIQPYLDAPTPFPVTEPLNVKPTGKKIAVIDCGSPICGLFADLAAAPAGLLGMEVTRIKAGTAADSVGAAFDTVLAGGFDGVFVPALAPSLWNRYLGELNSAKIPVVATGIIGLDPAKVAVSGAAETTTTLSGRLLAEWAVAQDGGGADVVFYNTPELSFSNLMADVFTKTMKELCADCPVRVTDIPVTSFGNEAPSKIVDDLLAHPTTSTAVFAVGEQAIGLPPAMKTAGVKLKIGLNSPDPSVLADIKNGTYQLGMGVDLPVLTWTLIDSLARLTTGQEPAAKARQDEIVRQLLTPAKLTGDVSQGWTGYPDFQQRFQKLWAAAK